MIFTDCEWCKQEFKDDDEIVIGDDGVFHEEECFMEWCWENYGSPSYTYKDYKKQEEQISRLG